MLKCKHEANYLLGTADGIKCRKCGKMFSSFATLKADIEAQEAPAPAGPAPEKPKPRTKKKKAE
jgi:hypothetical protein